MTTPHDKEELRLRFLQKLYDLSSASIHNEVPLEQIETESEIPPKLTPQIILYLSQKRLIELRIKNVCITNGGIFEIERNKQESIPHTQTSPTQTINYHTNIHGHNYGGIQQGGQDNTQLISDASIPLPATERGSTKRTDELSANKLYDQVISMSKDWETVDEVKAKLIIEYSKDAIDEFGKTNQDKKVELRKIIEKAEHVISPDSIDTFKKRAEKSVLKFVYPKNKKLRNIMLLLLGIIILLALILPFILGAWRGLGTISGTDLPTSKQRVVLILADVTRSLSQEQLEKSANLTADILDSLPVNSIYSVYPIQKETERILPLISRQVVVEHKRMEGRPPIILADERRRIDRELKEKRRQTLKMEMERLYQNNVGYQSCIINMLWFAQDQLMRMTENPNINPTKFEYELIIISDMFETCKGNPAINLELPPDLSRLRKSRYIQSTPNFANVRITIIFPLTPKLSEHLPSDLAVKEFWRDIFKQCGIKDEWFWDQTHIDWIPNGELPSRLKPITE
jgi:hypothetical protein